MLKYILLSSSLSSTHPLWYSSCRQHFILRTELLPRPNHPIEIVHANMMISNLSKVATLYLAPVLSLTSLILILFAYTAPTIILHSRVALLVVSPSLELTNSSSSRGIDGPTVFLGALGDSHLHNPDGKGSDCPATGSCSRPNDKGPVTCTPSSVSPTYGTLTWTSPH